MWYILTAAFLSVLIFATLTVACCRLLFLLYMRMAAGLAIKEDAEDIISTYPLT